MNNLEECINVTIPMDAAAYEENADYNATCVTWGEDDWTMGGCTTQAAYADHIECCCVHLSTFGALLFNTAQLEVDELQHTKSEVRLWLAIRTCCSPHH